MPGGVIGNTSALGAEVSRFEPWPGSHAKSSKTPRIRGVFDARAEGQMDGIIEDKQILMLLSLCLFLFICLSALMGRFMPGAPMIWKSV